MSVRPSGLGTGRGDGTGGAARSSSKKKHFQLSVSTPAESGAARLLTPVEFAAARAAEMEAMQHALSNTSGAKRIMQTLPKHMRRRAASHNAKRLPVKLREAASKQIDLASKPGEKRKNSRKTRRKPSRLVEEFAKRGEKSLWLETHVWHAKLMHMTTAWGCRIPETPCDKGARAAHRAVSRGCTLYDSSHSGCIELTGRVPDIKAIFAAVLGRNGGSASASVGSHESGGVESHCLMYNRATSDGSQVVSPVTVMWRGSPPDSAIDGGAMAWVWAHLGSYADTVAELARAAADLGGAVTTRERRQDLCRFELSGPGSHEVLRRVLRPVPPPGSGVGPEAFQRTIWDALSELGSPGSLGAGVVLGLTVHDPRLCPPHTLAPTVPAGPQMEESVSLAGLCQDWPTEAAESELWDAEARTILREQQQSIKQLNDRRAEQLVPGTPLDPTPDDAEIPVLLVQRPGAPGHTKARIIKQQGRNDRSKSGRREPARHSPLGHGAGWDLIIPSGWWMAFWLPLVHAGGRAIGAKEHKFALFEQGRPAFPDDYPDSRCYAEHAAAAGVELEAAWRRRPTKRRVNFEKMGIRNPFTIDWQSIVRGDSCPGTAPAKQSTEAEGSKYSDDTRLLCSVVRSRDELAALSVSGQGLDPTPLIGITVTMLHRGAPSPRSEISLPVEEDLATLAKDSDYGGPIFNPKAPLGAARRVHVGALTSASFSFTRGFGCGMGFIAATALRSAVEALAKVPDVPAPAGSGLILVRETTSRQFRFAIAIPQV